MIKYILISGIWVTIVTQVPVHYQREKIRRNEKKTMHMNPNPTLSREKNFPKKIQIQVKKNTSKKNTSQKNEGRATRNMKNMKNLLNEK